jgi:hypothetical protein
MQAILLYDADRVARGPKQIMLTQANYRSQHRRRPGNAGFPSVALKR